MENHDGTHIMKFLRFCIYKCSVPHNPVWNGSLLLHNPNDRWYIQSQQTYFFLTTVKS